MVGLSNLAVAVDCYAGARGDETPRRFTRGDQLVEILAVVARCIPWFSMDGCTREGAREAPRKCQDLGGEEPHRPLECLPVIQRSSEVRLNHRQP